jgi:hypothetical protein
VSVDGLTETRSGFWASVASLFASSSTLICCALPAVLVGLGAGAALSSLVAVFPQIVWLSEYKELLFAVAAMAMVGAGVLQWRNRSAPCPTEPALRRACLSTRRTSWQVYCVSVGMLLVGAWFAFVQPLLD